MKRLLLIALLVASSAWGEGYLKQSTAAILKLGPFVDSTDGVTTEESLTIAQGDIQISKAGGAFAQTSEASPTTTHDADGWYPIPLTTTDTGTVGRIVVQVQVAGAVPVWWEGMVLPANSYDSIVAGTDYLDANTVQIEGGDATDAINAEADQALTDAGFIDSADLIDDFYNEALSGHTTAGTAGKALSDINADTNELQADWQNGGRLDLLIDAILEDTGTTLDGYLNSEIASILADTDEVQAALADGGFTDLLIDAILADTNELQADDYPARFTGIEGATFATGTDSLEAIRNQGDSAWATATGFSTHSAADVWTAGSRELSTPNNYKADVSGLSTFDPSTTGVNVDSIDTGAITADAIAANAIGASELAADAVSEIDAAWNAALTELTTDPGATPTPRQVLALIYMANRNRVDTTSDTLTYYNDAGEAVFTIGLSDDGSTFTRAEMADAE